MDNYTGQVPGGRAAAVGKPGMGRGNVPFAPGVMSGKNLGQQTNNAPLARSSSAPRQMNTPQPGGRPALSPGQGQQKAGPTAAPPPGNGTVIDPAFYMQLLNQYMEALFNSAKNPLIGGIY